MSNRVINDHSVRKVEIYKIIRRTAGGFHSWCESNVGRIRKPNQNIVVVKKKILKPIRDFLIERKWYQRVWKQFYQWFIKLFKRWLKK